MTIIGTITSNTSKVSEAYLEEERRHQGVRPGEKLGTVRLTSFEDGRVQGIEDVAKWLERGQNKYIARQVRLHLLGIRSGTSATENTSAS